MEKNEIAVLIGENLKRLIVAKGLKNREVAEKCHIEVGTLRKYLNGDFVMKVDRLYIIARALGVEVGELFKPIEKKE